MASHAPERHRLPNLDPSEMIGPFYGELRRMAAHYFQNERGDHTLQPTALVHELYLRWSAHPPKNITNRAQFFGAASRAMRQLLIEYARRHGAQMRGGQWQKIALDDFDAPGPEVPDYEAIDRALCAFEKQDPRGAQIAELRIFGGLSSREIAETLDMGESTVRQEWTRAKEWIEEKLRAGNV